MPRKGRKAAKLWSLHPKLHDDVAQLLNEEGLQLDSFDADDEETDIEERDTNVMDVHKRAAQCSFLCLQSRNGPYAVLVPCIRLKKPRVIKRIVAKVSQVDGRRVYEKLGDKEKAFESDAAIWARMKETYYADKGKRKA
ncbi:hypothetical protein CNMCM8980_000782 [Aspergillus fumigatiaffinis]|nr:hypothetical protein CNMCM5878_000824 [Aspergillus fumigatiaffinis]KAF4250414.1 hypothetical protein CNMCM8980_000782 [Aspergillus fumigatiaffinis]